MRLCKVISDELEAEEIKRRKKFFTHICGGCFGLVILIVMVCVFQIDGVWSLTAGAFGKGAIDFADFMEGV